MHACMYVCIYVCMYVFRMLDSTKKGKKERNLSISAPIFISTKMIRFPRDFLDHHIKCSDEEAI